MNSQSQNSYRQIFKSSALVGGASAITVALGIVRTKILAVLIGTAGMGLFGTLSSITALATGIAGMGLSTSGVRRIAEATAAGEQGKIERTAAALRRVTLILGVAGTLIVAAGGVLISQVTFGSPAYAGAIALLSLTVFFGVVSNSQIALVQGQRRIRDLALLNITGAVLSTGLSIPIVYFFREQGIVPFLIAVAFFTLVASWWYARKARIAWIALRRDEAWIEVRALLGMGAAFMVSGLLTTGVGYLTRLMILRQADLAAAGYFQAAWNLSAVYVGFILSAMAADYYPRLTGIADNHEALNRLVNEQTGSALLMALPGLLATLTFAPWVIAVLYSGEFAPAEKILRWQVLGVFGRVLLWPAGYVLLAKGRAGIFMLTEFATNGFHLLLLWFGLKWFGLPGLGMAFAATYVVSAMLLLPIVFSLTGFVWRAENPKLIGLAVAALIAVFLLTGALNKVISTAGGLVITLAAAGLGARELARKIGIHSFRELKVYGKEFIRNRSAKR